jgi:excisionase family DNA binding protein
MKTAKPRLPYIPDQLTYTLEEAAAKLSQRTRWPVRKLIQDGRLRAVWVGREQIIYHEDLVKFLTESEKGDRP